MLETAFSNVSLNNHHRKLDPPLLEAEMFDLVKCATECVYSLPVNGLPVKKKSEEMVEDNMEVEALMKETLDALHFLLKQFLTKNSSTACLYDLFKVRECIWFIQGKRAYMIYSR